MSSVLRELRRTRRVRRLGELEWFEVAYRVYLVALIGGTAVLWLSELVTDDPVTAAELVDVRRHGASVLGLALAAAVALGLRSGSDGGPIALEAADVRHLLLAPISRRAVLLGPVVQRLRAITFGGAIGGAIAGQLAAGRLPGSPAGWIASGAVAGATVGAAFVAVAVLTHALRVPRAAATAIAVAVLGLQVVAAAGRLPAGPGDTVGSLAMWGLRQHVVDLAGPAAVVIAAALAMALAGRLRAEPLVQRADLVAQLRFAVTMQDLRTVMLLRRQLRGEHPRRRPWFRLPARLAALGPVWRRGWQGFARYPTARLVRMAGLALGAGAATSIALAGTTPAVVGTGIALHLLGLDAAEPLSQEVDHPDHTDGAPKVRGWILLRHLAAPAVVTIPFAMLGAAVVAIVRPEAALAAFALAPVAGLAGLAGSVVSVVRDAPDPLAAPATAAMPPEFAGFASTIKLLWPVAVSTTCALPILALREDPTAATALRVAAALTLLLAAVGWWVRRREEWRRRWHDFLAEGRSKRTTTDGAAA